MKILSLSGFIPEQICDIVRFTGYRGEQKIAHYCGYAADYISQVLEDETIDGAVFPRSCDSCRSIGGYLAGAKGKFLYRFHVPARRDHMAASYLAAEIKRYRQAVERHYGVGLEEEIPQRVQCVNRRNAALQDVYQDIGAVSYEAYLNAIHGMLAQPLCRQSVPAGLPGKPAGGKRVYLVGPFLPDTELAALIENAGMSIVGDNLTESKRLFSASATGAAGDIYENIAHTLLHNRQSPSQNDFPRILEDDLTEIREKEIKGVIFVTQKFCEPYDYLLAAYREMLAGQGIPVLHIALSGSRDTRRQEASVEAFADIL